MAVKKPDKKNLSNLKINTFTKEDIKDITCWGEFYLAVYGKDFLKDKSVQDFYINSRTYDLIKETIINNLQKGNSYRLLNYFDERLAEDIFRFDSLSYAARRLDTLGDFEVGYDPNND